MGRFRKLGVAVVLAAIAGTTLAACGDDGSGGGDGSDAKTLKLWHYESANSAMGIA